MSDSEAKALALLALLERAAMTALTAIDSQALRGREVGHLYDACRAARTHLRDLDRAPLAVYEQQLQQALAADLAKVGRADPPSGMALAAQADEHRRRLKFTPNTTLAYTNSTPWREAMTHPGVDLNSESPDADLDPFPLMAFSGDLLNPLSPPAADLKIVTVAFPPGRTGVMADVLPAGTPGADDHRLITGGPFIPAGITYVVRCKPPPPLPED